MTTTLLIALAMFQQDRPPLSVRVPPAMEQITYRLIFPEPSFARPSDTKLEGTKPGDLFFAYVMPSGKEYLWCALRGDTLLFDRNYDGDFSDEGETITLEWEVSESGAKFSTSDIELSAYEGRIGIGIIWKEGWDRPILRPSAQFDDKAFVFSRYIMCRPADSVEQAPIFSFIRNWTFAPDYINLSGDIARALYSPGSSVNVHMELGSLGYGENSFLGRSTQDIPKTAYVQAEYQFTNAKTGKPFKYLAKLRERC